VRLERLNARMRDNALSSTFEAVMFLRVRRLEGVVEPHNPLGTNHPSPTSHMRPRLAALELFSR
jgi:hypothetical protein